MIGYRGQCQFVQYLPDKPIRRYVSHILVNFSIFFKWNCFSYWPNIFILICILHYLWIDLNLIILYSKGLKLWIQCDAKTGYCNQFSVYLGKETKTGPNGLIFDIIDLLTKPIQNHNHRVFFDNYYTSYPILKFLLCKGIYSTCKCDECKPITFTY